MEPNTAVQFLEIIFELKQGTSPKTVHERYFGVVFMKGALELCIHTRVCVCVYEFKCMVFSLQTGITTFFIISFFSLFHINKIGNWEFLLWDGIFVCREAKTFWRNLIIHFSYVYIYIHT